MFKTIDKHTDIRNIDEEFERKNGAAIGLKRFVLYGATCLLAGVALNKAFSLGCEAGITATSRQYNEYIDELKFIKTETSEETKNAE